jgi:trafficking protein particle complex subunit 13
VLQHRTLTQSFRLTRPSLVHQFPLPQPHDSSDASDARVPWPSSLAYPRATPASTGFILTPLLALPESFQSAHVGELFACTLSANIELPAADDDDDDDASSTKKGRKAVSGLRVGAEIASPSTPAGIQLELEDGQAGPAAVPSDGVYAPGDSLQKVLRLNLQEEGDHTLAVTVAYTETTVGAEGKASGGRVRTFRKLYQFAAANLLSVRTKAGEMEDGRYVLEAQLENLGESGVVLEVCFCLSSPAGAIAQL